MTQLHDPHLGTPENTRSSWLPTRAERKARSAAADAAAARAAIETERARAQAAIEALEHEAERLKVQAALDAQKTQLADNARQRKQKNATALVRRVSLAVVLAGANVGVNAAAVLGQVLALVLGLKWEWWAALPIALVVESVAVNVGYFAHDKLVKGYSALWLRFLSYGIGAAVGAFNYLHNAEIPATDDFALVFGGASLLSPVLWQIYSQWRHWELLRVQGLLEARAPKFAKARWIIPSLRDETWQAFKVAVAEGITSPEVAIAEVRARTATGTAERALRHADQILIGTLKDALQLALTQLAKAHAELDPENPAGARARLELAKFIASFRPFCPPLETGSSSTGGTAKPEPIEEPPRNQERPSDEENRRAKTWIVRTIKSGKPVPSKSEVAARYGFSEKWAWTRIQAAKEELSAAGWDFPASGLPVPSAVPVTAVNGSAKNGGTP